MKIVGMFSIICLFLVLPLWAGCLVDGGVLVSSLNCTGVPTIDKYFAPSTFSWWGKDYLAVNTGNDITLWNITNPLAPTPTDMSNFHIHNQGDSNYDLVNYSMCDDCQFGVATFKLGHVLFPLGILSKPDFGPSHHYESGNPEGAFTFSFNGVQYLVANKLPEDCGGDATLYIFNGVEDIEPIGCIDVPAALPVQPTNGIKVGNNHVYLGFSNTKAYIFEIQPIGGKIALNYTGNSLTGQMTQGGSGLSVDYDSGLAVSAIHSGGLKIYDIANPASPVEIATVPGYFTVAAINKPFLWAAKAGWNDSIKTFNIKHPESPVEMDDPFWDLSNPWNNHSPDCEWPNGAVFSLDASTLYLARHAVVQMVNFRECPPVDVIFADGFESGDTSAWDGEP